MSQYSGYLPNAPQNVGAYVPTVEAILQQIGLDPAQVRLNTDGGYGWSFRRGSALVEVYLNQVEDVGFFQVLAPMMHIPQGNLLPLYRRLLELNLRLSSASLGMHLDVVYVFSERAIDGLDAVEANQIINTVAGYADDLDDQLVAEFGGRLYSQG